jgi:hypothetical protein
VRIAIAILVACGSAVPQQPNIHRAFEPTRVFRRLAVDPLREVARRTTFELTADGDRAKLVETEERARGTFHALDDRGAAWTVVSTRSYRGARQVSPTGEVELDLSTADMQPLHLHCISKRVEVAPAGTDLVATGTFDDGCGTDTLVWRPTTTLPVAVLECGPAGQPADVPVDDDDLLVFAIAPGVESATARICEPRGGLRVAR